MKLQKFRWSKVYESSEEELLQFLRARDIKAERWAAEADDRLDDKRFEGDVTLWCAEGSLMIHCQGAAISLQPGDALPLPATVPCQLDVGMTGCVCYQSARPTMASSLA